jgi:hypothetical protein
VETLEGHFRSVSFISLLLPTIKNLNTANLQVAADNIGIGAKNLHLLKAGDPY